MSKRVLLYVKVDACVTSLHGDTTQLHSQQSAAMTCRRAGGGAGGGWRGGGGGGGGGGRRVSGHVRPRHRRALMC